MLIVKTIFWLDGSSTLPFKIISLSFAGKAMVEDSAKILAEIEVQAKIAKSWVEIHNFDHWCHAASELVDLAADLLYMELDYLYVYEASISLDEKYHQFTKLDSQLKNSVCFSTFECTCERLANKSSSSALLPFGNIIPHCDSSPNLSILSTQGDAMTIESQALPLLKVSVAGLATTTSNFASASGDNKPAHTTATPLATSHEGTVVTELPCHSPPVLSITTSLGNPLPLVLLPDGPTRASVVPHMVPLPCHHPVAPHPGSPTSNITLCDHEGQSNDHLIVHTRVRKVAVKEEEAGEMGKDRSEERLNGDEDRIAEERQERREENTKAGATSKLSTPIPTSNHRCRQENGNERCR